MVEEEKQLDLILEAYENFSHEDTNGYDLIIEQKLDETITNKDHITQRIDWDTPEIVQIDHYIKHLGEFDSEQQFIEANTRYIYTEQKIGEIVNEEITWENTTDDYISSVTPIDSLNKGMIKSYEVTEDGKFITVESIIKDNDDHLLLGSSDTSINNMICTIRIEVSSLNIMEINISYAQSLTKTTISFIPYYEITQIEIPE
jgi:hypothetical protein